MGIDVYRKGILKNFMNEINSLSEEKPDFVFNLVESIKKQRRTELFYSGLLNMYAFPIQETPRSYFFLQPEKLLQQNDERGRDKKSGIFTSHPK